MKKTEQRIAIAEACGWKESVYGKWELCGTLSKHVLFPPDYLEDLNAMHEAERLLDDEELDAYCDQLGGSPQSCVSADAATRAEAFLIVKGLWKD